MTITQRHVGRRGRHARRAATEATSIREPYGISQVFAAAFGTFWIVIGAVGLARGDGELTGSSTSLMGMTMTPLLSVVHLGIGILALASAVSRSASRAASTVLGAGLIALGIIALIQPIGEMGWSDANGIAYLISGALAIAAAAATPVVEVAEHYIERDVDEYA